jgi:hypothetical protein
MVIDGEGNLREELGRTPAEFRQLLALDLGVGVDAAQVVNGGFIEYLGRYAVNECLEIAMQTHGCAFTKHITSPLS